MALYKQHIAKRMAGIRPFYVMDVLARARQLEAAGRDIIHMEIGEPDFPTPQPVIQAATQSIAQGDIHYTPAMGLAELRQAIADFYAQRYDVTIGPEQIIITPGASGALLLVLGLLIDRDQQVMMADPGYPCLRNFTCFVEGRALCVPVSAATGYQLTQQLITEYWHSDVTAVMLASPSNPTGTLISDQDLSQIAQWVIQQGSCLVVDEIYHGLVYEGVAASVLSFTDDAFVINSFSKYFSMTGWRIGWLVSPPAYVDDLTKLAQNLFISAPTTAQYAALAALQPQTLEILEQRRHEFQRRRDFLLPALRELGFSIPVTPQGAFYLYANCEKFTQDSFNFCFELLEQTGVAITPGKDFGNNAPEKHLRFAYTASIDRLEQGVERLRRFLAS